MKKPKRCYDVSDINTLYITPLTEKQLKELDDIVHNRNHPMCRCALPKREEVNRE